MFEKMTSPQRFFFLLSFTKELIIQSKTPELIELEKKLRIAKEIDERKKISIKKRVSFSSNKKNLGGNFSNPKSSGFVSSIGNRSSSNNFISGSGESFNRPVLKGLPKRVQVPDVMLPNRFSYLRPVPTNEILNLGRLQQIITDPRVREVECDGPDSEVIVRGSGVNPRTNISLTNDEIKLVFLEFSRVAMIPIEEEIVKVAAGGWIINGVNSSVVGSRFVMKRIQTNSRFR